MKPQLTKKKMIMKMNKKNNMIKLIKFSNKTFLKIGMEGIFNSVFADT